MGFIGTRKQFIDKYGQFIVDSVNGTGILPGTLITQAIVESQSDKNGVYYVGYSKLSREANNFFGIKCAGGWNGAKYYIDSPEEDAAGNREIKRSCFRKYASVEDSIKDYIKFIQSNERYTKAGFFKQTTVLNQFKALKAAGYATGNNYVNLLNSVYTPLKNQIDSFKPQKIKKKSIVKAIIPIISIFAALYYIYDTKIK